MRKLITVVFACLLALAGCSSDGPSSGGSGDTAGADFNDADVMFAQMMIPHHQQAIEMAELAESKSSNQQVLSLAADIKAAQQPEIETMQGWLAEWGVSSDDMDMGEMEHGGGMMSDEDMAALESASGAEAAPLFLEQMIAHHQGAIEMAETELANGKNADALALARSSSRR